LSASVGTPPARRPPGAASVSWSTRPDTRHLLNLKSCELQSPAAESLLADALARLTPADLWRYPYQRDLVELLAEAYTVPPECVALSAGSNAAIGTVVDALAVPAGRLITQEPSFESWLHFAALRGVPVTRCPGVAGPVPSTTVEAFETALASGPPAVAAITNPGNPVGDLVPLETIRRLARAAGDNGHVLVIDDCYGAFAGTEHLSLLTEFPHVLVIRSLSKSWGLAGARLAAKLGFVPVDELIVFLDGDLTGLATHHVDRLVRTVATGGAVMSCGLFDRGPMWNLLFLHVLPILTGQRCMRRELFEELGPDEVRGYRIEAALNCRAIERGEPVAAFVCRGMFHRTKEEKYGAPLQGWLAKVSMLATAFSAYGRYLARRRLRHS
jgi:hypothetical protein